ncbi:MAG: dihydrolipoamide dehydrogenase [Halomonadaceae bacterium T82-2]|nr:MAG: dihydrolipoamide dehydrogenase [Halomonadaceae bacterium T82-2]
MARKDESSKLPDSTQLAVIGGGPGGYAAAFEAVKQGLDVTLINDEAPVGGVCLLRGCIPSKTLLEVTELIHTSESAETMGLRFARPEIDVDALRQWKQKVVKTLTDGLEGLCRQRGVRLVRARARFADDQNLTVEGDDVSGTLRFEQAIIASGSRPVALPGVDFAESRRIMDSTGALELEEIPESLLVIGGGYVGLEMGMVYQSLGSQVTVVEMAERLMPNADEDLVKPLARTLESRFKAVHLKTQVSGLHETQRQVTVTLEDENGSRDHRFSRVLVAVGRRPNSEGLDLDKAGVSCDDAGFIEIDAQCRTSVSHIHAIGDVAGGMLLAHEAMHQGKVAARTAAGQSAAFDARAVPAVVYTVPQLAWCGLTEAQARDEDREIQVLKFPWQAAGRALSLQADYGLSKLIVEPDSGRLLGAGIVGPQAESLIGEAVLAIEMGAVAEDLALTVHPHPTLTETLGEAGELFLGGSTHYG